MPLMRMRRERLERAIHEMERAELDALILGREANARYVSGARRLWTVGARPFGPSCVVVRRQRTVHVVSTWDDGIPAEIPREHLIQGRWNPTKLMEAIVGIPGLGDARRIGVDGMTPLFSNLLSAAFPQARWVDGMPAMLRARMRKTKDEIACIRTATALAEAAFAGMADEIRPGASERTLLGRYHQEAFISDRVLEDDIVAVEMHAGPSPPCRWDRAPRLVAWIAGVMDVRILWRNTRHRWQAQKGLALDLRERPVRSVEHDAP